MTAIDFSGVEAAPVIFGRSELERWATCPAQAQAVEQHGIETGNAMTASGQEAHDVLAGAVAEMIRRDAWQSEQPDIVRDYIQTEMLHTRPDVQPDVVDALKRSAWSISRFIGDRHHADIMRHDGGEGDMAGQVAADMGTDDDGRTIRLTCEVDLLLAESETEITLVDWKSGWTEWTPTMVRQSFQFGTFYAWVLFNTYPAVDTLNVVVWMTRANRQVHAVLTRDVQRDREARLQTAVNVAMTQRAKPRADAWPDPDKCANCPATALCPVVMLDASAINDNPAKYLMELRAVDNRVKVMTATAKEYVKEHGPIHVGGQLWPEEKPSFGLSSIPAISSK